MYLDLTLFEKFVLIKFKVVTMNEYPRKLIFKFLECLNDYNWKIKEKKIFVDKRIDKYIWFYWLGDFIIYTGGKNYRTNIKYCLMLIFLNEVQCKVVA